MGDDGPYEPSSDDLLDLLLDFGQHLYTRDKPNSRVVMAAYRRIAHLEKKTEKLLEQRDEARRDAVEAETYVGELETKLAKTQTFIYELWDSQGYDASELHDLLKELDGGKHV